MDLHEILPHHWTLIGGQLVHLHCAERGTFPVRPTNDADIVIDVRAEPAFLRTFTRALEDLGFRSAGVSAEGRQHRWKRGVASIDVLLPEGIGERAAERHGVTGSPTLSTEGGTQALHRSQVVAVTVAGRTGCVPRPSLVGALVVKAAAHTNVGDVDSRRHRRDFLALAGLVVAADFAGDTLSKKDTRRLRSMLGAIAIDRELLLEVPGARESISRLRLALNLDQPCLIREIRGSPAVIRWSASSPSRSAPTAEPGQ